eukprot:c17954_g1_i1.p1 GENE.c17954_g1_i1~~c17954_g1_i1.p1  ORF type:complete len:473 (+),score=164.37 c17954_g1_i1:122-1420(+)
MILLVKTLIISIIFQFNGFILITNSLYNTNSNTLNSNDSNNKNCQLIPIEIPRNITSNTQTYFSFLEEEITKDTTKDVLPTRAQLLLGDPRLHPQRPKEGIIIPVGQKFFLNCACNQAIGMPLNGKFPFNMPRSGCAVTEVRVKLLIRGDPNSYQEPNIRDLMGDPLFLKWVNVQGHHFSSIEGRTDSPVLATPGGDMAEFINALDVFEEMTHTPLIESHCQWYLREYLKRTKKRSFYMATDTSATKMIQISTGFKGLNLREPPPPQDTEKVLEALLFPEHIGCAHLRGMIMKPEEYDLRPGLPQCAIRAFFRLLWNFKEPLGKKLRLVELDGKNMEKAVVKVKVSKGCMDKGLAPLITPRSSKGAIMLFHSQATTFMRTELSEFFTHYNRWIDAKKFKKIMDKNGLKYEEMAIWRMARTGRLLPVFEVEFA